MIHENVKRIRESKGVSKTHIANKLDISLQGYRHIENGETRLSAERLKIIAKALGEEPNIFFEDKVTDYVNCQNEKQTI